MHKTLFLRLALTFISFTVGTIADYGQLMPLYLCFTIINGVLGFVIFVCHGYCDAKVGETVITVKN